MSVRSNGEENLSNSPKSFRTHSRSKAPPRSPCKPLRGAILFGTLPDHKVALYRLVSCLTSGWRHPFVCPVWQQAGVILSGNLPGHTEALYRLATGWRHPSGNLPGHKVALYRLATGWRHPFWYLAWPQVWRHHL